MKMLKKAMFLLMADAQFDWTHLRVLMPLLFNNQTMQTAET
jgi:hypothetical protein